MEPSPNEQSQASPATSLSHTSSTTPHHVKEGDEEADTLFMPLKSRPTGDSATISNARRNTLDGDFATLGEDERRELTRIATTLTYHQSNTAKESTGPDGAVESNPALNPESDQFDLAKWLQHFVQQFRDQGHMVRKAGIVFRNLGVSGTGEALQLQSTVGDYLTSPLRPGELFSFRAKAPKQILHNFNGLVKSGELMIVLGRPGSGCSTLLKSMCGELHCERPLAS